MKNRHQVLAGLAIAAVLVLGFVWLANRGSTYQRHRPDDGSLHSIGTYSNNLPEGKWSYYHRNGRLWKEGRFERGMKVGTWMIYKQNGEFSKREHFDGGSSEGQFESVPGR